MSLSPAQRLARMPEAERLAWLRGLSPSARDALMREWTFWARPEQLPPPGEWGTWLVLAGRGWGKTRVGAEWVRSLDRTVERFAFVGSTMADVRDTMVEGESGVCAVYPRDERPRYIASKRRVEFASGAFALLYSDEEPDRLRGPQHGAAWCDELASWPRVGKTWSNLQFGLRLGSCPRALITTTPRPIDFLRELVARARAGDASVRLTTGATRENSANLAREFVARVQEAYGGTRLGRQELEGEILGPVEGGLVKAEWIRHGEPQGPLGRVVVGLDPAISTRHDETGIVVVARAGRGFVVLEDLSGMHEPGEWARLAVHAARRHQAHEIVAERNRGGDMVRDALRIAQQATPGASVRVHEVTAYRGKDVRAEPLAALYEQGRGTHARRFEALEQQLIEWSPALGDERAAQKKARSPDRLDALVHAVSRLGLHLEALEYPRQRMGDPSGDRVWGGSAERW